MWHDSVCNTVQEPTVTSTIVAKKTTTWRESGFPSEFLGLGVEDLFHHALAVLHDPAYREANAGALRMEWPRIPLPGWPDGDEFLASASRGRELAALLDPETPVPGVTAGPLRPELAAIAVPSTADARNMIGGDFALTAGWGHFGAGDAVIPGQGRAVERAPPPSGRCWAARRCHTGRYRRRRLPKRQRPVEQYPRRRVELQAGWLPGPQKVAVLPGKQGAGPHPATGGGAALHRHGAADSGNCRDGEQGMRGLLESGYSCFSSRLSHFWLVLGSRLWFCGWSHPSAPIKASNSVNDEKRMLSSAE